MFFDDKKRLQTIEDRLDKIEATLASLTVKEKTREVTPTLDPILMTSERSKKIMDSIKREIAGT